MTTRNLNIDRFKIGAPMIKAGNSRKEVMEELGMTHSEQYRRLKRIALSGEWDFLLQSD